MNELFKDEKGQFIDAYMVLGVEEDTPQKEIDEVFENFKKIHQGHEVDPKARGARKIISEASIKRIHIAYQILTSHRREYDIEYAKQKGKVSTDEDKLHFEGKLIDFYKILGIKKPATDGEIRAAYRKILEENRILPTDTEDVKLQKTKKISEADRALEVLLDDPKLRALYDAEYAQNFTNATPKDSANPSFEELMGLTEQINAQKQTTKKEVKEFVDTRFYIDGKFIDLFGTLGLDSTASKEELTVAYKKLGEIRPSTMAEEELAYMHKTGLPFLPTIKKFLLEDEQDKRDYDAEYARFTQTNQLTRENTYRFFGGLVTEEPIPEPVPETIFAAESNKKLTPEEIETMTTGLPTDEQPAQDSIPDVQGNPEETENAHPSEEEIFYTKTGELKNFYALLKVESNATEQEIKNVYPNVIKQNAVLDSDSEIEKQEKRDRILEATTAYEVLTQMRDAYDAKIETESDKMTQECLDSITASETDFYVGTSKKLIDFYSMLGVSKSANDTEIAEAYKEKLKSEKLYAFDKFLNRLKQPKLKELKIAYDVLTGDLRDKYDRLLNTVAEKDDTYIPTEKDFYTANGLLRNLYIYFGISRDATDVEIQKAYEEKMRECQIEENDPDLVKSSKKDKAKDATIIYNILMGPLKGAYDAKFDALIAEQRRQQEESFNRQEEARTAQELADLVVSKDDFWMESELIDFYRVLHISETSNVDDIRTAFEEKMATYKITLTDTTEEQAQKRKIQRDLMLAYKILTGSLRKTYDETIAEIKGMDTSFNNIIMLNEDLFVDGKVRDFYSELGITPDADFNQIKEAFYRSLHHKVFGVENEEVKNENKAQILQAFAMLTIYKNDYLDLLERERIVTDGVDAELARIEAVTSEDDFYDEDGNLKNLYELLEANKNTAQADLKKALIMNLINNIVDINDDELTQNRKEDAQVELEKAYIILTGSLRTQYNVEFDQTFNKGGDRMNPDSTQPEGQKQTAEELEYEQKEKEAKEAFARAQEAKVTAARAKAAAEIAKLNGTKEEAAAAAEAAKATAEVAKEALDEAKAKLKDLKEFCKEMEKDAKEKIAKEKKTARETKKEAKKMQKAEKKATRKAKKAEKDAEKKINRIKKQRVVLVKDRMGGRLTAPFRFVGRHWKKFAAGASAVAIVTGAGFGVKYCLDNDVFENIFRKNPDNDDPKQSEETIQDKNSTKEESVVETESLQENWNSAGMSYTEEEIAGMVNSLQGNESSVDIDTADDMVQTAINSVLIPALDNCVAGEQAFDIDPIDISSIIPTDDPAYEAISNMEDYFNDIITGKGDLKTIATQAIEDQIRVIALGETVDGFNAYTSSPVAKITWARLATAINALAGTLGEDFKVIVDGATYTPGEVNSSLVLQTIVNSAKSELGQETKIKNMNN